jgi:hypothetical protein
MRDKVGVLAEMRRLAPEPGTRLLSVYAPGSVPSRQEWYRRLGLVVSEETTEYLLTKVDFVPSTSRRPACGRSWATVPSCPGRHGDVVTF